MQRHLLLLIAAALVPLLALLGVADIFIGDESWLQDYVRGIFTETLGIIVTLIFVEMILQHQAAREDRERAIEAATRADVVLTALMRRCCVCAYYVTTPW